MIVQQVQPVALNGVIEINFEPVTIDNSFIKQFISKVYRQCPNDFIERFKPSIDFTVLSEQERLYAIIDAVKTVSAQDLEWFYFWYLE